MPSNRQHIDNEDAFGSTGEFHAGLMGILWGPGANIAIFLVLYNYRKIWVWLHGAYFFIVTILTLASSIPILTYTGIISANSNTNYKYSASTLNIHYLVGIACMIAITIVTFLGIATKLMNIFGAKSNSILIIRKIHAITGYLIALLCKANNYIITNGSGLLIACDVVFAILIIIWKLIFPRMEHKQISPKIKQGVMKVMSIRELNPEKDYVVFANYVYDVEPLKINHPAGFQIVNSVKNKQVDRYIYGSCAAEQLPQVPTWSHSYRSFTLMDNPVAQINIEPTFNGFDKPEIQCTIPPPKVLSEKGNIYQINLYKKQGSPFTFAKYKDITQLGRYFSLTLNKKVTRLYTTVNFLVKQNQQFLSKYLPRINDLSPNLTKQRPSNKYSQSPKTNSPIEIQNSASTNAFDQNHDSIPIMFKKYPGGKFTQQIVKVPVENIIISCSKGQGLQLAHTKPGKIIIVAGGTGLYPFSDLIDLLYKQQLMAQKPPLSTEIINISPILNQNPLSKFTFQLLAAFNHINDIHQITLQQLLFLAERGRISITFKFKQSPRDEIRAGSNIKFDKKSFEDLISEQLASHAQISKIWICGPPKMNENVSRFIRQKYKTPQLYLLV